MRHIALTAIVMLMGFSTGAPPAVALRHKLSKCPLKNEGVVDADAQAVVYKASTGIFGCAYGAKRAFYLGPSPYGSAQVSGGTSPIMLAGPIVAYAVDQSNIVREHEVHEVWVRNLRTGKLIHRMPNGSPAESGNIGLGDTTAIVVKSDGSVAWIVGTSDGPQVRSVDQAGEHLLAATPEIDRSSLALAGSTLYWLQGGKPMSATLN